LVNFRPIFGINDQVKNNYFLLNSWFFWSYGPKTHKIRIEMSWRLAASLSPKPSQAKVTGHQVWPHVAVLRRTYLKYIFASFIGSTGTMNAFRLIIYCQGWSNDDYS
jgi:hypothetical protein